MAKAFTGVALMQLDVGARVSCYLDGLLES
jgi:hypothetical protein